MTKKNWERLRNLVIFRVWATDRQLRPLLPWVALLGSLLFLTTAAWWWFHR